VGKCPKCNSISKLTTDDKKRSAKKLSHHEKIGGDDCHCCKLTNVALPTEEIVALDHSGIDRVPSPATHSPSLLPVCGFHRHKFEIPIRFGGHSWQSIACIWTI
jgi:hypothetical protein